VQPHEQVIECNETGGPTEDVVEAGAQFSAAPHVLLCGAMQVGECAQLVYQLFRMHPAERLPANGELASAIADNHYLAQHLMGLDVPPHRLT
jgi:hypothetical protein